MALKGVMPRRYIPGLCVCLLAFSSLVCLSVCLLLAKSMIFQVPHIGQSILLSCLFVCLSVCLSVNHLQITILNWSSWNFTKLLRYSQLRSLLILRSKVKFLHSSFFIWLTWKLNRICILHHWIGKPTIWVQKVKGQLEVKLLKSSISIWKINLHPINLKVEQHLHSPSLNWESNNFWGQRSSRGQTSKIKFHLKNRQVSSD